MSSIIIYIHLYSRESLSTVDIFRPPPPPSSGEVDTVRLTAEKTVSFSSLYLTPPPPLNNNNHTQSLLQIPPRYRYNVYSLLFLSDKISRHHRLDTNSSTYPTFSHPVHILFLYCNNWTSKCGSGKNHLFPPFPADRIRASKGEGPLIS